MAERRSRQRSGQSKTNVDNMERKLEQWGNRIGKTVAAAAARTKEEAEDIWAEAQSIRRGERK